MSRCICYGLIVAMATDKPLNLVRNMCYFDNIKRHEHFSGYIKACKILSVIGIFKCLFCNNCWNALMTLFSDPRSFINVTLANNNDPMKPHLIW